MAKLSGPSLSQLCLFVSKTLSSRAATIRQQLRRSISEPKLSLGSALSGAWLLLVALGTCFSHRPSVELLQPVFQCWHPPRSCGLVQLLCGWDPVQPARRQYVSHNGTLGASVECARIAQLMLKMTLLQPRCMPRSSHANSPGLHVSALALVVGFEHC